MSFDFHKREQRARDKADLERQIAAKKKEAEEAGSKLLDRTFIRTAGLYQMQDAKKAHADLLKEVRALERKLRNMEGLK